jgi:hypothetical protein
MAKTLRPKTGAAQMFKDTDTLVHQALAEHGIEFPAHVIGAPRRKRDLGGLVVRMSTVAVSGKSDEHIIIQPRYIKEDRTYAALREATGTKTISVLTLPPRNPKDIARVVHATEKRHPRFSVAKDDPRPVLFYAAASLDMPDFDKEPHLDDVKKFALKENYRLVIATAPRTSELDEGLIKSYLDDIAHRTYYWKDHADHDFNPYLYYLDRADTILVTGDSLSMISDAVNAGKRTLIAGSRDNTEPLIATLLKEKVAGLFEGSPNVTVIRPADDTITGWYQARKEIVEYALKLAA